MENMNLFSREKVIRKLSSSEQNLPKNDQKSPNQNYYLVNNDRIYGSDKQISGRMKSDKLQNHLSTNLKEVFEKFDASSNVYSDQMRNCAFELCSRYLGGSWRMISIDQLSLKAITGGMSNLLFQVRIMNATQDSDNSQTFALLRIHCDTSPENQLKESVVFTLLSERGLGPKLLGVFPGGRFEQYIPSRPLKSEELGEENIGEQVGRLLARIHSLNVPITKDVTMIEMARTWLSALQSDYDNFKLQMKPLLAKADPDKYPAEITHNLLKEELDLLEKCLSYSNSPVLFCHNDLQEGNILLCENNDDTENKNELILIDFEYAGYNYRGFDLANHMCEYMFDYTNPDPPYYTIFKERFPNERQQENLIEAYIKENSTMGDLTKNAQNNTKYQEQKKQMTIEIKRFPAASHLLWSIWSFMQIKRSPIKFDYANYGLDRLAMYFESKQKLQSYEKNVYVSKN